MARKGWIKLSHKLADNALWLSESFTRGQAWVDLLILACGKDENDREAGELWCSVQFLANRWKWSFGKVKRYLKSLEEDGMIFGINYGVKNGRKFMPLLTIAKYRSYQLDRSSDGTKNGTENSTKNGNNKEDNKTDARPACAGGRDKRQIPEGFRERFATYEEFEEWRNQ